MIRERSAAPGEPNGTTAAPDDGGPGPAALGWAQAALEALAVLVVGFVLLVYGPHLILTRIEGLSRSSRGALAGAWFLVALAVTAWALRRLQRRHVI